MVITFLLSMPMLVGKKPPMELDLDCLQHKIFQSIVLSESMQLIFCLLPKEFTLGDLILSLHLFVEIVQTIRLSLDHLGIVAMLASSTDASLNMLIVVVKRFKLMDF